MSYRVVRSSAPSNRCSVVVCDAVVYVACTSVQRVIEQDLTAALAPLMFSCQAASSWLPFSKQRKFHLPRPLPKDQTPHPGLSEEGTEGWEQKRCTHGRLGQQKLKPCETPHSVRRNNFELNAFLVREASAKGHKRLKARKAAKCCRGSGIFSPQTRCCRPPLPAASPQGHVVVTHPDDSQEKLTLSAIPKRIFGE